jgi:hypothetical protein
MKVQSTNDLKLLAWRSLLGKPAIGVSVADEVAKMLGSHSELEFGPLAQLSQLGGPNDFLGWFGRRDKG